MSLDAVIARGMAKEPDERFSDFCVGDAARGMALRCTGHYDEALADYSRAIELEPIRAWMIAGRGETYRLMGRYDDAIADLTRAIKLEPTPAVTLRNP